MSANLEETAGYRRSEDDGPVAAVRARSAQDFLHWLAKRDPEGFERAKSRIDPEIYELVDTAARTEWLPMTVDCQLPAAVVAEYGEAEAQGLWRSFITSHAESPLLGGIINLALRMLGVSPGSLVKHLPKLWQQVYRAVATPRVKVVQPGLACIVFEDVATEVFDHPDYLVCMRGVFEGIFDLTKTPGELEFEVDAGARSFEATWRWSSEA